MVSSNKPNASQCASPRAQSEGYCRPAVEGKSRVGAMTWGANEFTGIVVAERLRHDDVGAPFSPSYLPRSASAHHSIFYQTGERDLAVGDVMVDLPGLQT